MPRRQNPQMHLFEAMIATFDATHDMGFQQRAGEFFALFVANLYDKQKRVLGEYFEEDWSKIEPVVVEPGHQAEWVWLLKGFERITGCPTGRHRAELLESALRYRDEATGGLVDVGDADGNIRRHTRRLWPQTEIAKAWIAQAESGEAGAADEARAALARLDRHYLSHPVPGGWYDQFDRDGKSLVATIPASSFYHVLCAVTEAEQVLG
jgi:mannose-6-phosphate isomerase